MTRARLALATGVSALLALGLLGATALPVGWHDGDHGALRLSWRARPERVEVCREPSEEELARVAEHMRQRLVCEGSSASYLLRVVIDDVVLDTAVVRGGGLRHDRLIQLLRDYPLPAGVHRIAVTLDRRELVADDGADDDDDTMADGTSADRATREASERARGRQAALPPRLALDTTVAVEAGRVVMVTFSPITRSLQLHQRPVP